MSFADHEDFKPERATVLGIGPNEGEVYSGTIEVRPNFVIVHTFIDIYLERTSVRNVCLRLLERLGSRP